jgi:hypothetical protein
MNDLTFEGLPVGSVFRFLDRRNAYGPHRYEKTGPGTYRNADSGVEHELPKAWGDTEVALVPATPSPRGWESV